MPNSRRLISCPGHTRQNFDHTVFPTLVERTVKKVRAILRKHPEIGALAGIGHSGLMLMGAVSYQLKMPQIAVRKTYDSRHDRRLVNGDLGCRAYLILEDLISSGTTIRHVIDSINEEVAHLQKVHGEKYPVPTCAAIYLYDSVVENFWFDVVNPSIPVYSRWSDHLMLPDEPDQPYLEPSLDERPMPF